MIDGALGLFRGDWIAKSDVDVQQDYEYSGKALRRRARREMSASRELAVLRGLSWSKISADMVEEGRVSHRFAGAVRGAALPRGGPRPPAFTAATATSCQRKRSSGAHAQYLGRLPGIPDHADRIQGQGQPLHWQGSGLHTCVQPGRPQPGGLHRD